jgi:hypothetical protein
VLQRLSHLRKLTLGPIRWTERRLLALQQLDQLRALSVRGMGSHELAALCQPPHWFQLDTFRHDAKTLTEHDMRALLHLPTLTALESERTKSDAWSLLPQLPFLQRLSFWPGEQLTAEKTSSLSASFAQCNALTDLSLRSVEFDDAATPDQVQARWVDIFRSMPNVCRLTLFRFSIIPLLALFPMHLPLLYHLALTIHSPLEAESHLVQLAHPSLRHLQLRQWILALTDAPQSKGRVYQFRHSDRLPKLEHIRCYDFDDW